jgi:hypothetical protein
MKQDKTNRTEHVIVTSFETFQDGSVEVVNTEVEVPIFSGQVVRAAALLGINDIFYKTALGNTEDLFMPETMTQLRGILDRFIERRLAQQNKSKIHLPGGGTAASPTKPHGGIILP